MATILSESFETDGNGTRYTTSIAEFTDGSGDFFLRTDGTDITASYEVSGQDGSFYFAAQDINGEGAASQQTLSFSGINITGLSDLSFSGLFAEDDSINGTEDWDLGDFLLVEYQIDSGGFQPLLAFESVPDGDPFNAVPAEDTDFDGDGDGTELTPTFASFSGAIAGTGATLDLRITFDFSAGDEDIAIDLLEVTGDAGPTLGTIGDLVINEVLPDPNSATNNFDTDGDGTAETNDEFVELYNTSALPVDASGFEFWDLGADLYFTVPANTIIDPGGFLVVVADVADGALPTVPSGSHAFSTGGSIGINNGGDNIVVYDPSSDTFIQAVYNGDATDDPADPLSGYASFSATATRVGAVLDLGNDTDGVSLALSPDGATGNPVQHNTIGDGSALATPGNPNVATTPPVAALSINEVDADTPDTDAAEFIEIFDGGVGNTSLDGHVLVLFNGNGDVSYDAIDLTGQTTDANGFFVVGSAAVPNVDLVDFTTNGVQNGADAVALYLGAATDFPTGTAPTTTNLIDAIAYDTNDADDTALLTALGLATQFNEDENGDKDNQSLSRTPDGDAAIVAQTPTPGATNVATVVPGITIDVADGVAVTEGGATDTFDISLNTAPSQPVTITIATDGETTVSAPGAFVHGSGVDISLSDTTPVTVTVTAVDDADAEGPHTSDITFTVASSDPTYDALAVTPVSAAVTDDEPLPITLISDIQGTPAEHTTNFGRTDASPLRGSIVTIEGVVVGDFQGSGAFNGFYVQEEDADADADPTSSEGIFVFDGSFGVDVAVGDLVKVTGTVDEFFGETQIDTVTDVTVVSSGNSALATPATISLPVAEVITNSDGEFIPNLEAYEGMLVTIPSAEELTVTDLFTFGRFGDLGVTAGGRTPAYTQVNTPDATGFAAFQQDAIARTLILDDGSTDQNPLTIPYPDGDYGSTDELRAGDVITSDLTGVVRYSRGSGGSGDEIYRINPTEAPVIENTNPRPTSAPDVGGSLSVASFNVLNYFTTLDDGSTAGSGPNSLGPRGADTQSELDRQTEKLVSTLVGLDADVVGLVEIENEFNTDQNGDGLVALDYLVDQLNLTLGSTIYAAVSPPNGFVDTGDAISQAIIYKVGSVEIAPGTVVDVLDDSDLAGLGLNFGNEVFDGSGTSRAALATTFREISSGEEFTVSVNHFKSKGSVSPFGNNAGTGDGTGNNNEARVQAATALDAWLATNPTGTTDEDILIIGDLNAYAEEEPITFLEGQGYTDLAENFGTGSFEYSFGFPIDLSTSPQVQGFGTLDYGLANASLISQVTGAGEWHINADEPAFIDYNEEFLTLDPFDPTTPFRVSDHDPLLIGLDLSSPSGDPQPSDYDNVFIGDASQNPIQGTDQNDWIDGKGDRDNINGGDGDDYIIAGPGNDPYVRGGAGADIFQYGPGDGDVKIHDWEDGIDKIFLVGGLTFADFTVTSNPTTTILWAPDGGRLMFRNTTPDQITEADFMGSDGGPSGNFDPIANDDQYAIGPNGTLSVLAGSGVLSNDTDADIDALSATLDTDVSNGMLTLLGDGSFTYQPDPDFVGDDTFVYIADDGNGGTDTATVTIEVAPEGEPQPSDYTNQFFGDASQNPIQGTNVDDWIDGGDDRDNINAKGGDDYIIAGPGNDWFVRGGGGADIFEFGLGDEGIKIFDWEDGVDKIRLVDGLTFGDLTKLSSVFNGITTVEFRTDAGDRLLIRDENPADIDQLDFI